MPDDVALATTAGGESDRLTVIYRAVPLALSALVYWPILRNYFFTDDFGNMYIIANDGALEFLLTPWGGHSLVARSAIFLFSYKLFGLDPHFYFLCAFVTHLLNVYLMFEVVRRLTGSFALACFGATLWGMAPDNEGSLGFYSVYGQVLVVTFLLWVLNDLLRHAQAGSRVSTRRLIGWYVLWLLAAMSYGNGLPVAMISPLMVYLLLPKTPERTRIVTVLSSLIFVVPALYVALLQLYKYVARTPLIAVDRLGDRLDQWQPIVAMLTELLRHGTSRVLLPYPCASDQPIPWLCLGVPGLLAAGVLIALFRASLETRRRLLAPLVMVVATYAIIAAARAPMMLMLHQTTDWGALQPRYHYLGQLGIAIILCVLLDELSRIPRLQAWRLGGLLVVWIAVILTFHVMGGRPIDNHEKSRREVATVLRTVETTVNGSPEGGTVYIPNHRFISRGWVGGNTASFPGWAAVFIIAYPNDVVRGRRVVFLERDLAMLARARVDPNKRIAGLLNSRGQPLDSPPSVADRMKRFRRPYNPAPSPSPLKKPGESS